MSQAEHLLGRCPACGTAAVLDASSAEDAERLHSEGTYRHPVAALDPLLSLGRLLFLAERRRSLQGVDPPAQVFEVGAGDGTFLEQLSARGYRVAGIDPAAPPGGIAERRRAEEVELEPGSQDAVVIWHTLEHLGEPATVLARVHEALVPGGLLVVSVPNLASLQARLGGDRWFHQDVPRHLVHFTDRGLVRLLERTGFRVGRVRHFVVEQGPFGMWQTAVNLVSVNPNAFFRAVKGSPFENKRDLAVSVLAIPLFPLAFAAESLAAAARRGGAITVEAVKPA